MWIRILLWIWLSPPSHHPAPAPVQPAGTVLKFIGIIFCVFGYLKEYEFEIVGDLNNVENGLEFENVIGNCEFDFYYYDLCNGLCCTTPTPLVMGFEFTDSRVELREQLVLNSVFYNICDAIRIGIVSSNGHDLFFFLTRWNNINCEKQQ